MAWSDYKKAYDMFPQSWVLNCLKMYKISDEVKYFIEKTMQTWRVELTAVRKSSAKANIQRSIFQGDALSSLLFVIAMMPLNHILRKCTVGYKLSKSQKKINHPIYMDNIELFANREKVLETLKQARRIQSEHRDGIWHRKMHHANNEKRKMTHERRDATTKPRKKLEYSEKKKPTNNWEYWKLKPSNKRR